MKPDISTLIDLEHVLFDLQEESYKDFQSKIVPTVNRNRIIGVRIPVLRKLKKRIDSSLAESLMRQSEFKYFEEEMLTALIIGDIKSFSVAIEPVDHLIHLTDNWCVCDSLKPVSFLTHQDELRKNYLDEWLASDEVYVCRFAIKTMLERFMDDENFQIEDLEKVSQVTNDDYYVLMAQAWYLSYALIHHWEDTIGHIQQRSLPRELHLKTIQKGIESTRLTPERKNILKKHRAWEL